VRPATVLPQLLLLLAAPTLSANKGEDVGPVQGEWVLLSTADEKRDSPGSADCKMIVARDGRVRLQSGRRTTNRGTIRVLRAGKATLVDLKLATGLFRGVCELKRDELAICFDEADKPRPAGMKPKGTQWLERWRRVKPAAVACIPPRAGTDTPTQTPEGS
jgi:uncharacterized protein (TIGR03067 family)